MLVIPTDTHTSSQRQEQHTNLGCVLHSPEGCAGLVAWHHQGKLDCPSVLGNNTEPPPAEREREGYFLTEGKQGRQQSHHDHVQLTKKISYSHTTHAFFHFWLGSGTKHNKATLLQTVTIFTWMHVSTNMRFGESTHFQIVLSANIYSAVQQDLLV